MTVAEQQRQEQELYRSLLPEIVDGIRRNEERVALSERVLQELPADTAGVDQQLLYRWIQLTEEKLEMQRKRAAALLAGVMWIGVLAVVVPVVGVLLGRLSFGSWSVSGTALLGGVIAILAALRLPGVTRRAYARWMERELG
ncbi:MAG: hypothetical protein R6U25_11335 [Alkalispirochaeta sp.]